jgi:acyl carrier protein
MTTVKPRPEVTRDAIFAYLKQLFGELFELPEERVTLDADLYHDLDIDSIDAIDLLVEAKEFTGQKLEPEVFKKIRTVDDVVTALYEQMNR